MTNSQESVAVLDVLRPVQRPENLTERTGENVDVRTMYPPRP